MSAIGRALMANPQLLLFDEITLGLAPIVVATSTRRWRRSRAGHHGVLVEQDIGQALGDPSASTACTKAASRSRAPEALTARRSPRAYFGVLTCRWTGSTRRAGHPPGRPLRLFATGLSLDLRRHAAREHRTRRPHRARRLSGAGARRDLGSIPRLARSSSCRDGAIGYALQRGCSTPRSATTCCRRSWSLSVSR